MRYRIETERVDLFDVSILITMVVRTEESIAFDRLDTAFQRSLQLHEVLRSRILIEGSGEAFYVENDAPGSSFSQTELSLPELVAENEKKRFRIEEGEFIRAFDSPDGLIFMMHHLTGDGKSLIYFIETFMSVLAGSEPQPLPFRNLTLDNLPADSRILFAYELLVRSWNRKWQKEKKVFGFSDMDKAYENFRKDHRTKIKIKRYDREESQQIIRKAKEAGVTFTSYFIAELSKELSGKIDVGLAVDGRTDQNRSMGNQATGISIQFRYNAKRTVEENARIIQKLIKKKLSNDRYRYFVLQFMGRLDTTLKDSLNLEHAGTFKSKISSYLAELLGYGKKARDMSITNLTRADIPLVYGDIKISEIIFVPPVVSYAQNVIGIVTAGDVMNVTWHRYE